MFKKRLMVMVFLACILVATCSAEPKSAQLRFCWWGNDQRTQLTLKVIDMYMKKHPNVKIEAEYNGKSDQAKIATQLISGTVADIIQLNPPWMVDMTSNGDFFVNFKAKKRFIDLSGFDPKFLRDYGTFNGKLIGLPTGLNAIALLMNQTVAKDFNIPTSMSTKWTWNDLDNVGKAVNKKDSSKYFLNSDSRTLGTFILRPYIKQRTGQQIIKDNYTLGFTRQNLIDALTYIDKLYKDKVLQPAQEANVFADVPTTNPKWSNGSLVAEFMWTSQFDGAAKDAKGEMGTFIFPMEAHSKDTGLTVQPAQLLGVSNKSKNIDEAVKFVNYFLNDVEAGKVLKDTRSIPPVKKVRETCTSAGLLSKNVVDGVNYGLAHMGKPDNGPSSNVQVEKIFTDAIEKIGFGSPVNQVADETIKLLNAQLTTLKTTRDKYKSRNGIANILGSVTGPLVPKQADRR